MSIAQRHTPFHSQQRHEDQERREGQTANNKQTQSSGPNSYRILGIEPSATDDEVKRAYRRMAMKYHPDRVATLSEDIRKNAEQQFRIINEAYETIRTARGMK